MEKMKRVILFVLAAVPIAAVAFAAKSALSSTQIRNRTATAQQLARSSGESHAA